MALVLFQSLRDSLENLEDLTESEAKTALIRAISLLPDVQSVEADGNILKITPYHADKEIRMPFQDAVDSVMMIWNDYIAMETPDVSSTGQKE